MSQDVSQIYQQIISAMNIHIQLFGSDYSQIASIDHHLREQLFLEHPYTKFIEIFQKKASSDTILKIKDSFQLYYYFYNTPQISGDGRMYFCIGPILREEMTANILKEILQKNQLSETITPELFAYYNRVPVREDLPVLEKTLLAVTSSIFEKKVSLDTLSEDYLCVTPAKSAGYSEGNLPMTDTIESMYVLEGKMLHAVSVGNLDDARKYFNLQNKITFRPRPVSNPLRHTKNRLIVLNVLLRKAIEKGGVHPIYIDEISSRFSIRIEKSVSQTELEQMMDEMLTDYCQTVQQRTIKKYHPLIQKCIIYIQQHCTQELTLALLADTLFASKQYLSSLFKKETGENITDFIHECQMHYARELLENTTLSISQITESCGLSNTTYFTKLFKKYYHLTPREYRKQIE